jgi:hypothetical protein
VRLTATIPIVVALLAFAGAARGQNPQTTRGASAASPGGHSAWYLVFEEGADGSFELYAWERVELAAPPASRATSAASARASRGADTVRVELSGAGGELVYEEVVELPQMLRGEFHGAPRSAGRFEIDHVLVGPRPRAFVARVPFVEAGTLRIESDGGTRASSFAVADLQPERSRAARSAVVIDAPADEATGSSGAGSGSAANLAANRVDLLVVGDGYTAAEQEAFHDDASSHVSELLAISPYQEYRNYVRVRRLFVPSAQSGADHPSFDASCPNGSLSCCSDSAAQSDPLAGTFVDTAFGGRFCSFNVHRLAVVDVAAVLAAAAAAPDWDQILALLNDDTYGGSGGLVAVVSTHPSATEIARHEYGHSFSDLADEYEDPFPGFPGCSDREPGFGCEANVTDETERSLVKWERWISASTPVPTPENDPDFEQSIGLFEGARYLANDMFRPRDHCLMRELGVSFDRVCREAYVLRLYRGGWGVPAAGIDPIEPDSEKPRPGARVRTELGAPVSFEVDLLQPAGGLPLVVTWLVDGVPVPGATGAHFDFLPSAAGRYEVELRVQDPSDLVHAENAAELSSQRTWTVIAVEDPREPCVADETTLCLEGGRFEVAVDWESSSGESGAGRVVPFGSDDSGLFSFFDADNWEMLVKVLDGCAINDSHWVFLAATTDLGYTLTVTDTLTGRIVEYDNTPGVRAPAVTDTAAFPGCSAAAAVATNAQAGSSGSATRRSVQELARELAGQVALGDRPAGSVSRRQGAATCAGGPSTLCLAHERFAVEVAWRAPSGEVGTGHVVPAGSPDSGLFYFFDPDNWEMLVKVLDACSVHGAYWVFAAATTDIELTLRVTDSQTGDVVEYQNPAGVPAAAITDTAAFQSCP